MPTSLTGPARGTYSPLQAPQAQNIIEAQSHIQAPVHPQDTARPRARARPLEVRKPPMLAQGVAAKKRPLVSGNFNFLQGVNRINGAGPS